MVILIILLIKSNYILSKTVSCQTDETKCDERCFNSDEECPTGIMCPQLFVKINSYTCSRFNRPNPSINCNDDEYTCWDNSCFKDINNCASDIKCPPEYEVRCHNNQCVKTTNECSNYEDCPNFLPIRCPIGGCRRKLEDCPNGLICPKHLPIMCNDYSCKNTQKDCNTAVEKTTCRSSDKKYRCPSGICVESSLLCPTLISCPIGMIKCHTGLCAYSYDECKNNLSYISDDKKVRCEFYGNFVDDVKDCATGTICPFNKPVKCWDGSCEENINSCPAYSKCPLSMIECPDGSCSNKTCGTQITCSKEYPFKCFDNTCRKNPSDCPQTNDCSKDKPIFCWDGNCYKNRSECTQIDKCPDNKPVRCPDFNCYKSESECKPSFNCPVGFYIQIDGSCKRKYIEEQEYKDIQLCPRESPVNCLDGTCVDTITSCNNESLYKSGEVGKILCANGKLISNTEKCELNFKCPQNKVKCKDNTCEDSIEKCNAVFKCPPNLPYQCENGACKENSNQCINEYGCFGDKLKCKNIEICYDKNKKEEEECDIKLLNQSNGCPNDKPYKCESSERFGLCVSDLNDCSKCGNDSIYCKGTGKCVSNIKDCPNANCPDGKVLCSDDLCADSVDECNNRYGCKMTSPYRCNNGECKKNANIIDLFSNNKNNTCGLNIECPLYRPYLCYDYTCVEKKDFCRLFDKTSNNRKICPSSTPILCNENVNCMNSIIECKKTNCYDSQITCIDGTCQDNNSKCLTISPKCSLNEVMCFDGSCKKSLDECNLYSGCTSLNLPYKCKDGKCAGSEYDCNNYDGNLNREPKSKIADEFLFPKGYKESCIGKTICEDGICREKCPEFNGCPSTKPLLCSTGRCVVSYSECAGYSNCSITKPYKCSNGECKERINECNSVLKLANTNQIILFTYPNSIITSEILITSNMDISGSITVKENTFFNSNVKERRFIDLPLKIKTIPRSVFNEMTVVDIDSTRQEDVLSNFPYSERILNNTLEFEYSVLSPVVSILPNHNSSIDYKDIKFINNYELSISFNLELKKKSKKNDNQTYYLDHNDVCIGKYISNLNKFNCAETSNITKISQEINSYKLITQIKEFGEFAVILNPKQDMTLLLFENNIWIKYFSWIVSGIATLVLLIFIVAYILIKINRFRNKYKKEFYKKNDISTIINEMQNVGNLYYGQTIGDSCDNFIFTVNPCYKVDKVYEDNIRLSQLEKLEEDYLRKIESIEKNNHLVDEEIERINNEIIRIKDFVRQFKSQVGNIDDIHEGRDDYDEKGNEIDDNSSVFTYKI